MTPNKQIEENVGNNGEISLKELFINIKEYWIFFRSKWLIILLFGILGAAAGFAYANFKKPVYVAELSLVMEDSKSNSLGNYAAIASQFGIDVSGGSGSGVFSGDNILAFLKSRLLVEKALLSPVVQHKDTISLAELYIDAYNLRKGWTQNQQLQNLKFPPTDNKKNFSLVQDSIMGVIYTSIVTNSLQVSKPDKKLGFILVSCKSAGELFAKVFTERLVKEASLFYIETKTTRSRTNVDKLQIKADSLEKLLNQKTYSAAVSQDLNANPARRVAMVGTEVVTRDKMVLQTMYAEVVKNLEMSKLSMAQETPVIQIVDSPILPLKKEKLGKLKALVIGGILAGFLTLLILTIRKVYADIMK